MDCCSACRTQRVHRVAVECRDGGQPVPLVTSRNVTVRVADAGTDVPRFSRCVYEISLAENNRPGSRVLRVSARDRDVRRNSSVRYSLANDANGIYLFPMIFHAFLSGE